jgi:cytochrome c oxidase subunit IV
MEQHSTTAVYQHEEHGHAGGGTKEVMRITLYLTIITLVELGFGFYMYKAALPDGLFRHVIKGIICALMLWKAFYIVGYFMHLKHEIRNLIMTIVVPLFLFVWFIIAFLADGNSYKNLRNKYDPYHIEQNDKKAPVEHEHGAQKEGTIE